MKTPSKFFGVLLLLALTATSVSAISTRQSNLQTMDNGKSLYGETTGGLDKQLIGVNSSDGITIDGDSLGATFGGTLTSSGILGVSTFLKFTNSTTCSPSAATAATVTPVGTRQVIAGAAAISTVNIVATTNIANGTIVYFKTNDSSKDVVFTEVGNCILGATTRRLSDVSDRLALIYDLVTNRWCELFFADNN